MSLRQLQHELATVPHMTPRQGAEMHAFVQAKRPRRILELGFKHGVSTCYMAAALEEIGEGHITTIDLPKTENLSPNVTDNLDRFNLLHRATVIYEPDGYLWTLRRMLRSGEEKFDMCFFDGAHSWPTDGLAFFLVDQLMAPGGWLVFDDLDWTYAGSAVLRDEEFVKAMTHEQREMAQVREIYDLLVKTHPAYDTFEIRDGWAYARKATRQSDEIPFREEVVYRTPVVDAVRWARRRLRAATT